MRQVGVEGEMMQRLRCLLGVAVLALGIGFTGPLQAADGQPADTAARAGALESRNKGDDSAPQAVTAGTDDRTCEVISEFNQAFLSSFSFKGNSYCIESDGRLERFEMELRIDEPAILYFTILRRELCDPDLTYSRVVPDIRVEVVGQGRRFYGVELPNPILLEEGKEYLLGVAWGAVDIANSRDTPVQNQYP
jgi:hypothetical protein